MKHFLGLICAGVTAAALVTTAAAADPPVQYVFDHRCRPAEDFCWSTVAVGRFVFLEMKSQSRKGAYPHEGAYRVCVDPPRGKVACKVIQVRYREPGPFGTPSSGDRLVFQKSFQPSGAGRYRVTWRSYRGGRALSPVLTFDLRANGTPRVPTD